MSDMHDFPIVKLLGSEKWTAGFEAGQELDKQFPDQSAEDFAAAVENNGWVPDNKAILQLKCVYTGEGDGEPWCWLVVVAKSYETRHAYAAQLWFVNAWCDYTGWECQSNIDFHLVSSFFQGTL